MFIIISFISNHYILLTGQIITTMKVQNIKSRDDWWFFNMNFFPDWSKMLHGRQNVKTYLLSNKYSSLSMKITSTGSTQACLVLLKRSQNLRCFYSEDNDPDFMGGIELDCRIAIVFWSMPRRKISILCFCSLGICSPMEMSRRVDSEMSYQGHQIFLLLVLLRSFTCHTEL